MSQRNDGSVTYASKEIRYKIIRERKYRSLRILIKTNGEVIVKSPKSMSSDIIKSFISQKAKWIYRKLLYVEKNIGPSPIFLDGEKHLFVGNIYKLEIIKYHENNVNINLDTMLVRTRYPENELLTKHLVEIWYLKQAQKLFTEKMNQNIEKFSMYNIKQSSLRIERLNKKWGQCDNRGRIKLNTELIKAPNECIDYVIIHELCHLIEHNHSKKFYALLSKTMPSWKKWKKILNQIHIQKKDA